MNESSAINMFEFCISEKEGMSKIVCDQLVKLISCCSTKVFMQRLILLQELADSWTNNKDIRFITKGTDISQKETVIVNGFEAPNFYICEKCGSLFESATDLNFHAQSHHDLVAEEPKEPKQPLKCKHCEKEFSRPESLKRHIRTHSGEISCICDECGKSFSRLDHLTIHMRKHSGKRPYICNVCGKQFSSGPHLKKHLGVHKKTQNPFICNCHGQAFSIIDALKAHLQESQNAEPGMPTA